MPPLSQSDCLGWWNPALSRHQGLDEAEAARNKDVPGRGGWTSLPGNQAITDARKTNGKCMTCEYWPALHVALGGFPSDDLHRGNPSPCQGPAHALFPLCPICLDNAVDNHNKFQ